MLGAARKQAHGRAGVDELPEADDDERVARGLDLGEQVRGDQDGPAGLAEPAQQCADLHDAGGVQPVRRLVEQEQLGVGQQRRGDAQALLHAEREAPHRLAVAPAEADDVEHLVHPRGGQAA